MPGEPGRAGRISSTPVYCVAHAAPDSSIRARPMITPTQQELIALELSLAIALRSVVFSLPPAILVAWVLTRRRFVGKTLLDAVVHLPLVLPPVAVGYVLLLLFGTRGPIGGWLERTFGIELIFTRNGAALATAVMYFPLIVRAIRISLESGH